MTLKLAAFGTGFFSRYHYDAWSRIPDVELVGIGVRQDQVRAQEFATEFGGTVFTNAEEMLDRTSPDLVDVITTPESHEDLVRAAVERRIPVICQKPLAPTEEGAQRIIDLAARHDTLIAVHENWRFRPWNREVKRLLDAGAIGPPCNITFRMRPGDGKGPGAYLDRQPYFQEMPRFLIHETGIHMIDVFRYLLGEMTGVFARLRRLNPAIAGEDAGLVTFAFDGGAAGLLDGNRLVDFEADNPRLTMGQLLIEGEDGSIRIDGAARIWIRSPGGREHQHLYAWSDRGYAGDSVHALQAHVVRHLLEGTPVENAGSAYLRNVAIEEAVYRSHEEERWIACAP